MLENDKPKRFQQELKALLSKYGASISIDADDCSDWYGMHDMKMVVEDSSDNLLYEVSGTAIYQEDIAVPHSNPLPQESPPSLDDLLEEWSVLEPGMWENDSDPKDWYAVCNQDGIIAYFSNESDAYRFRLSEINRILNG